VAVEIEDMIVAASAVVGPPKVSRNGHGSAVAVGEGAEEEAE
jgi:hypothetical protein